MRHLPNFFLKGQLHKLFFLFPVSTELLCVCVCACSRLCDSNLDAAGPQLRVGMLGRIWFPQKLVIQLLEQLY